MKILDFGSGGGLEGLNAPTCPVTMHVRCNENAAKCDFTVERNNRGTSHIIGASTAYWVILTNLSFMATITWYYLAKNNTCCGTKIEYAHVEASDKYPPSGNIEQEEQQEHDA
jgi:hypothetical protein